MLLRFNELAIDLLFAANILPIAQSNQYFISH